jgi:hypothetical protein
MAKPFRYVFPEHRYAHGYVYDNRVRNSDAGFSDYLFPSKTIRQKQTSVFASVALSNSS